MRIYFVRHGETDWNKERKIQGQVDIPLNAFGIHLAEETAKGLRDIPFDICFSSPLGRAKETARIILAGRDVPIVEDLRIQEMGFAEYEGHRCSAQNWDVPDSFRDFFEHPERFVPAEGGEDFSDMKERTGEFLSWLFAQKQYENSNVLVATHGAALAGLLNNIKGAPLEQYWGAGVHKNCAVTAVEVTDKVPRILWENRVYYKDQVKDW